MKYMAYTLLVLASFSAPADDSDIPINSTAELTEWCKEESQAYYLSKDMKLYNWTASWWTEGNILHVKGGWRVQGEDVTVHCRIVKGARKKYAVYEIVK